MTRAPIEPKAQPATFVSRWAVVTALGALCLTIVDGFLLERSKSYFTGGFLATDHLSGVSDTVAFLATSFVSDAAVVGMLAAIAMLVLTRWRVCAAAAAAAGLLAGIGPLFVTDVISYELTAYVGDLIDLSQSLELGGECPRSVGRRLGTLIGAGCDDRAYNRRSGRCGLDGESILEGRPAARVGWPARGAAASGLRAVGGRCCLRQRRERHDRERDAEETFGSGSVDGRQSGH